VGVPRWSPDGQRIAFEARLDAHTAIFIINGTGGPPRQLTDAGNDAFLPSWSPDGRWVYFSSNQGGRWQIWKQPAEGGAAVQVTQDGGFSAQPDPDARYVYYARSDEAGLWRIPVEGGPAEQTDIPLGLGDWANWAVLPSGLYYAARDSAGVRIIRVDPTGKTTSFPAPGGSLPTGQPSLSVSPDGSYALYTRLDRLETDIKIATQD
jgi:dipeptidyl aminopeptidase/acylaminoacyl peptidase